MENEALVAHVTEALAAVLDRTDVQPDDDFFLLGMTSMLIARLSARVGEVLDLTVPLLSYFEHPTPRLLATALAAGMPAGPPAPLDRPADSGVLRRASLTQEHRLLFNRYRDDGRTQPLSVVYNLRGPVDVRRLRGALDGLMVRHDALRMVFPRRTDEPLCVRVGGAAGARWPFAEIDLSDDARGEDTHRRLVEFCDAPFDLDRGPLAAALLVRTGPDRHVLALRVDHLICDGMSMDILVGELGALYAGHDTLPDAPGYAGYASAQLDAIGTDNGQRLLAYWRREFDRDGSFPPRLRPVGQLPAQPLVLGTGVTVGAAVAPVVAARVPAVAAARRATPFAVYLTALLIAVRDHVESDRIGVAFMESGRQDPRTEGMVGNLANELQAWFQVPTGGGPDLITDVGRRIAAAASHSVPMWWMARHLRSAPADHPGPTDIVDLLTTVPWLHVNLVEPPVPPRLPGIDAVPYPRRTQQPYMRTPVVIVNVFTSPNGAELSCDFAAGAYQPDRMRSVLEDTADQLTRLVTSSRIDAA